MERIVYVSESEVWIIFLNRPAVCITSMSGYALEQAYMVLGIETPAYDGITKKVAV